jgi:hypothetical protein
MTTETKQCQKCRATFVIEPEDFDFYRKIDVPPPTFCPDCRFQRRLTWRNERTLYRRNDIFGRELLSIYDPIAGYKVMERDSWWSDAWDPMDYGTPYDQSVPFFSQFHGLLKTIPLSNVFSDNVVDSPYVNHVGYLKNCYLSFASWECENVIFGEKVVKTKDTLDAYLAWSSELCYEIVDCRNSQRLLFSRDCDGCMDSAFLYDCKNCSHCFGCVGLRNAQYHIFNQPRSREQYLAEVSESRFGSYATVGQAKAEFSDFLMKYPRRFANLKNTINVTGDHCSNLKNCRDSFDLEDVEDSKFVIHGGLMMKDSYDGYGIGDSCEMLYEGIDTGVHGSKERFSVVVYTCQDTHYCFNCSSSSHLFACVGLRNKQYCILNTQYTKDEYEALIPRIKKHMDDMPYVDSKGREYKYGEFFPPELSPFAYNETIAQEYFPLTKDEATQQGFRWRDPDTKEYKVTKTPDSLPDHIKDIDDSILQEVIGCSHKGTCSHQCTTAFKIIPEELSFYRRMNLPLPRLCPNCRHYERLKQRNPLKLWRRRCMCTQPTHQHGTGKCSNEFETSYAPDRKEVVYCEGCYNAEVV